MLARTIAIVGVIVAVVIVAVLLFDSGGGYHVNVQFQKVLSPAPMYERPLLS